MIRKLLSALGFHASVASPVAVATSMDPYKDDSTNFIYHLLFCDRPELFKKNHEAGREEPWFSLFKQPQDPIALQALADDINTESRVRMLAFNALRQSGHEVIKKVHLGTILEVPMHGGLDTLAVYADGSARYINHSGRMAIVEGKTNPFEEHIQQVIAASIPIVTVIGPWDKDRLPPPSKDNVRMTFLVSDGLYFGQASFEQLSRDGLSGPLIHAASQLLSKITQQSV